MGRCLSSTPMFIYILAAALILTGAFTAALWVTLNRSAVSSVSTMADRLHLFLIDQLNDRIMGTFNLLFQGIAEWSFSETLLYDKPENVRRFTYRFLTHYTQYKGITIGRVDGSSSGSFRMPSGEVVVANRPASAENSTGNLTYYHTDPDNPGILLGPALSVVYDHRKSKYYSDVLRYGGPAFSFPFQAADSSKLATAAIPLFNTSTGDLKAVLAVGAPFTIFESALDSARLSLQSSGMLVLFGNDGFPAAFSTASPSTVAHDIAELNEYVASQWPGNGADFTSNGVSSILKHTFGTFGESFFFRMEFNDRMSKNKPPAAGLDWKLVAILPLKDYYGDIWRDNTLAAIYAAVYFVVFLGTLAIMSYVLITRPLHSLRRQLIGLAEAIRDNSPSIPEVRYPSCFMELRQLYLSASDAIAAQLEVAQTRSDELSRAAAMARASEQEALSIIQAKEMFFAVMSHEMRTPLTACIGMAEILLETTELDDHQKECITAILSGGSSMLNLVNDVLDLSKIQADRMVLETVSFDLRKCIEDLFGLLQLKAEEKRLELIMCIKADVPSHIIGDSSRLTQVLLNILSNAIKFTSTGTVSLTCSVSKTGGVAFAMDHFIEEFLRFDVVDTGIGMNEECLQKLFEPFVQADASMTRRFGGTGLGLVISKRFVQLMGGTISITSPGENQGCHVTICLPLTLAGTRSSRSSSTHSLSLPINNNASESHDIVAYDPPLVRALAPPSPEPLPTVLVIDRHPLRRNALCEMLKTLGVRFTSIETVHGLEACPVDPIAAEASVVLAHLPPSGIVVCEVEEAMKHSAFRSQGIRSMPRLPHYTSGRRVVWITPLKHARYATEFPMEQISLPLTFAKLRGALLTTTATQTNPRSQTPSGSSGDGSSSRACRVLVVDDVVVNQRVLGLKLRQQGYEDVDYAGNGLEAVQAVAKAPFVYDFILMDVMMPEMNGYEATQAIRADPRYAHVPIIGITGNCSINDIRTCIESGMTAALGKPIDTEKLLALIKQHDIRSSAAPAAGQTKPPN